jgi:O-antigen/teichoic acid export membrane protein
MIRAVLRDSFVYGVASILSRGLALFVLPIYTRVLAPADYGALDMITTFGALANLVVALEVSQGLARFWPECATVDEQKRLASSAWWFSVVMYALFLVASLFGAEWINTHLLGDVRFVTALRLGLVFICLNGLFCLLQNQFRWELRSREYALVSMIYSALTLSLGVLFAYGLHLGLPGIMWGQILAAAIANGIAWWRLRQSFVLEFDLSQLCMILSFSAPLVPSGLATFVSLYINRLALNSMASLYDVGLFGIGNRIASVATLLIIGIQGALTPLVYAHYQEPDTPKQLAKLFEWFLAIALFSCLGLSLFARELLLFFATPAYLPGAALVAFLAPALLLSQMYIFAPGIAIKKKTHWQLAITIVTALISAVLNLLLVPRLGVQGAAFATLMTGIVFFSCWVTASQRLYPIPFRWLSIVTAALSFAACVLAGQYLELISVTLLESLLAKSALLLLVLPLAIVATGLIQRTELSQRLDRLRQRFVQRPN